jgi:spore coat protein H
MASTIRVWAGRARGRSVRLTARAGLLGALMVAPACRDNPVEPAGDAGSSSPEAYNPDWTVATHGRVAPNYGVAFPQAAVNTLEIRMTAQQWSRIRTNMRSLYGADFGAGGAGGGGPAVPDPDYVDVSLTFDGKRWKNVGFRLKGNSSLTSAWRRGIYKLPFRLNFDRYEDEVPAIRNQRFHGFEELSFSPGFNDNSLIREKVASDIFRLAGVPAARTAFYRVYIDFGEGLKYCGVYTAVEVVDDTMVKDQFGEDSGNLYKPESRLQTFVASQFEKKNNLETGDYSDVQALITALNSPLRTSDPARWRTQLEGVFDVDHFLRWLAVNNAMVNWDTYGAIAHNFYLYNHSRNRLTWIPWDHNEALQGNPGITGTTTGGPGMRTGVSLSMNEVGATWPLLRYLADDPVYRDRYRQHLGTFNEQVFLEGSMDSLFDGYHALIAPYVVGSGGEQPGYTFLTSGAAFTAALPALKTHVRSRKSLVEQFLR